MSQSQSQMHQHQKISLKCWRSWFWHFSAYIICHMVFDRILLIKSFELYRAYTLVCCLCFRLIRITPLVVIGVECPLQYPSFIPGDTSFMQRYQSKGAWIGNRHGQDCHGGGWWWCWVYRWCWCWVLPRMRHLPSQPLLLMKLCHLVPCPAKAMVKQLSNNQSMFFGITLWMEIMVCIYMCKAQRGVKPKLLLLRPKLYLKHTPII